MYDRGDFDDRSAYAISGDVRSYDEFASIRDAPFASHFRMTHESVDCIHYATDNCGGGFRIIERDVRV
jgi:hypothetical protein